MEEEIENDGGFALWALLSGAVDRVSGIVKGFGLNALRRQNSKARSKKRASDFWEKLIKSLTFFQTTKNKKPETISKDIADPIVTSKQAHPQSPRRVISADATSEADFSAVTGKSERFTRDAAVAAAVGSLANVRNQTGAVRYASMVEKGGNDNKQLNRHLGKRMDNSVDELTKNGLMVEIPEYNTIADNNNDRQHDEAVA